MSNENNNNPINEEESLSPTVLAVVNALNGANGSDIGRVTRMMNASQTPSVQYSETLSEEYVEESSEESDVVYVDIYEENGRIVEIDNVVVFYDDPLPGIETIEKFRGNAYAEEMLNELFGLKPPMGNDKTVKPKPKPKPTPKPTPKPPGKPAPKPPGKPAPTPPGKPTPKPPEKPAPTPPGKPKPPGKPAPKPPGKPKPPSIDDLTGVTPTGPINKKPPSIDDLTGVTPTGPIRKPKPPSIDDLTGVTPTGPIRKPKPPSIDDLTGVTPTGPINKPKPPSGDFGNIDDFLGLRRGTVGDDDSGAPDFTGPGGGGSGGGARMPDEDSGSDTPAPSTGKGIKINYKLGSSAGADIGKEAFVKKQKAGDIKSTQVVFNLKDAKTGQRTRSIKPGDPEYADFMARYKKIPGAVLEALIRAGAILTEEGWYLNGQLVEDIQLDYTPPEVETQYYYDASGNLRMMSEEDFAELSLAEAVVEMQAQMQLTEELDEVGSEDEDVDNDGDSDKSDDYLKNRREAVSKAMQKKTMKEESSEEETEVEQIDEVAMKGERKFPRNLILPPDPLATGSNKIRPWSPKKPPSLPPKKSSVTDWRAPVNNPITPAQAGLAGFPGSGFNEEVEQNAPAQRTNWPWRK